tara:strand:+ start:47394 stop:47555 length:162 start_codon:yes stop_codon:yes gene_type:complete
VDKAGSAPDRAPPSHGITSRGAIRFIRDRFVADGFWQIEKSEEVNVSGINEPG